MSYVSNPRLIALLSAIAEHYKRLNEAGRAALIEQMMHLFPHLKATARSSQKSGSSGRGMSG